jgi:hypothetical protein
VALSDDLNDRDFSHCPWCEGQDFEEDTIRITFEVFSSEEGELPAWTGKVQGLEIGVGHSLLAVRTDEWTSFSEELAHVAVTHVAVTADLVPAVLENFQAAYALYCLDQA